MTNFDRLRDSGLLVHLAISFVRGWVNQWQKQGYIQLKHGKRFAFDDDLPSESRAFYELKYQLHQLNIGDALFVFPEPLKSASGRIVFAEISCDNQLAVSKASDGWDFWIGSWFTKEDLERKIAWEQEENRVVISEESFEEMRPIAADKELCEEIDELDSDEFKVGGWRIFNESDDDEESECDDYEDDWDEDDDWDYEEDEEDLPEKLAERRDTFDYVGEDMETRMDISLDEVLIEIVLSSLLKSNWGFHQTNWEHLSPPGSFIKYIYRESEPFFHATSSLKTSSFAHHSKVWRWHPDGFLLKEVVTSADHSLEITTNNRKGLEQLLATGWQQRS